MPKPVLLRPFIALALLLALAVSCAPRLVPVPVVTAPKFPDYLYPSVPEALDRPQLSLRQDRGWQFLQAGDLAGARREFSAALDIDPRFYPAEAGLAYVSLAAGEAPEAEGRFRRILSAHPGYVPALTGRGDALVALSRLDEAIDSYEEALTRDQDLVAIERRLEAISFRNQQSSLQRARDAAAAGRHEEAIRGYERAIAASPESAFLYRELAAVEGSRGETERALEHLRRAAELDPSDARAWAQIGELLEDHGDLAAALAAYERAYSVEPSADLRTRIERVREGLELSRLPSEYRAIANEDAITRGQLAALIVVELAEVLKWRQRPSTVVLTDVRRHWAAPWIQAVVRAGIMEAYPNHTFAPAAGVRRLDLATIVSRVLNLVGSKRPQLAQRWSAARPSLPDVPPGHLGYPAAAVAVSSGVMSLQEGAFRPLQPVSGEEAVEVVRRLEGLAR
jgi:tetratricopeptide (TPR) repeat protein